jgi:hypothetical protein
VTAALQAGRTTASCLGGGVILGSRRATACGCATGGQCVLSCPPLESCHTERLALRCMSLVLTGSSNMGAMAPAQRASATGGDTGSCNLTRQLTRQRCCSTNRNTSSIPSPQAHAQWLTCHPVMAVTLLTLRFDIVGSLLLMVALWWSEVVAEAFQVIQACTVGALARATPCHSAVGQQSSGAHAGHDEVTR